MERFEPIPGQQTFSLEDWNTVASALSSSIDTDTLGIIVRASYSTSFGADIRALMRSLVLAHVADAWEE